MRAILVVSAISILMFVCSSQGYSQIWNRHLIDNAGDAGYNSRIAVTSQGKPYVLYIVQSELRLAWWVPSSDGSGGWNGTLVGYTYYLNYRSLTMRCDANDDLHIAWGDYEGAWWNLSYRVFDSESNSWQAPAETIIQGEYGDQYHPDIALVDSAGTTIPAIVSAISSSGNPPVLKYATRDPISGAWSLSVIYDQHPVGNQVSIAVDSQLGLHVSFYETLGGDLMYAKKFSGSNVWSCSYVDIADDVGMHSSIIVDSEDRPHIVYYDRTNGDLKYAKLIGE